MFKNRFILSRFSTIGKNNDCLSNKWFYLRQYHTTLSKYVSKDYSEYYSLSSVSKSNTFNISAYYDGEFICSNTSFKISDSLLSKRSRLSLNDRHMFHDNKPLSSIDGRYRFFNRMKTRRYF